MQRSDYDRMLAGEPCRPDDPRIVDAQLRGQRIMERFNATGVDEVDLRRTLLGELLGHLGAGSVVVSDLPANVVAVGNPARVVKQL